jgi:uncharacterized protein (TIGR03435 family)
VKNFPSRQLCGAGVFACALAVGALNAQTPPAFEVASIKQDTTGANGRWVQFLPGGRLDVTRCDLSFIIQQVYDLRDFQIVDAPKWLSDWSFLINIQAKAAGPATTDQLRAMTQQLLAERFQLKVHREARDLPIYALVLGKNGPKQIAKDNGKPRGSGYVSPMDVGWLRGTNVSMSSFARALATYLDRPVLDKTGFADAIDFDMRYTPDQNPGNATGPSIFTAVQELGLKLEPLKSPVEVLVIDHVERPTPN